MHEMKINSKWLIKAVQNCVKYIHFTRIKN